MDSLLAPEAPPAAHTFHLLDASVIEHACTQACRAIAPAWPLDRAIAVNPHWERVDRPVREVAARMAVLGDMRVFAPRAMVREAWHAGRITAADLAAALRQLGEPSGAAQQQAIAQAIAALDEAPAVRRLPLLIDVLDDDPQGRRRLSWRQAVTHQVSQVCAAYFDTHQADWQPDRTGGLYAFWRETLTHDHSIGVLMGLPQIARGLAALPATRAEAERWVLQRLGLPPACWADYLEAVLLTVNGWASWCAWLGWEARQAGREDAHLRDLLAIRLAWGAILLECRDNAAAQRAFSALQDEWERAPALLAQARQALRVDEVWQLALELGYQRQLAQRLVAAAPPVAQPGAVAATPEVQAAFCIDVRSEPLRRAIESVWPAVQTIGFAGFFGLPVAYTPLATAARRPQLPGLLAPAAEVTERIAPTPADFGAAGDALQEPARQQRLRGLARADQWDAGSRWPSAAFSFVEAVGAGYLGQLAQWMRPPAAPRRVLDAAGLPARYRPVCRPLLAGLDAQAKVELARRVLHAMGLERGFAPLVLLVGHGSQSANNAQAAALDCGACCGQTGEVNARVLARLLNDPAVRQGLKDSDIALPPATTFVAALHNTTTDEIEGFDLDLLDADARARWERLQAVLAHAGDQVRRERAGLLGLDLRAPHDVLLEAYRRRANDGAQTRPEWGLAGNAAFIIAPRERSRAARLGGRVFLHDYSAADDADGSVLELLMTAPMLVTHWINWQYHASASDPQHLGSGNKLLHNVVGGRIGVFEGNGGDLRIGLSRQSLHDGTRWVHEPLRLTVVIDAPASSIERVIAAHAVVRQLVENGWLHLWRFEEGGFARYSSGGGWHKVEC